MNKLFALFLSLFVFIVTDAQRLTSTTPVYDCGQVLFRSPVSTTFVLKNKSSRHTTIRDIETSCGCTTAQPSQQSIGGGKEVNITVTYDAKQLGHFEKQIFIHEEGQKKPTELTLKGVVVTELEDFTGTYPYNITNIRCDLTDLEFDDVNLGQRPQQVMHIYNNVGKTIQPQVMHLPAYLRADVSPTELRPGQAGIITFTLESSNLRDMGLSQTTVYLGQYPGDKIAQDKEIGVSAVLLPNITDDDRNSLTSPSIQLSAKNLNLSDMTGKPEKLKGEIIISNSGQSDLEISSLQMFTIGLQVSLAKRKLKPGEQTKLKIQANAPLLKQQRTQPRILMITNDPRTPKLIIELN